MRINPAITKAMHDAAADALADIAEDDLRDAREVVPIEEGTLSRSGFTEVDRANLEAQVAFDTPYAVKQEVDVTLRHDNGRKAHYLADTVEQNRQRHVQYLQEKVSRA